MQFSMYSLLTISLLVFFNREVCWGNSLAAGQGFTVFTDTNGNLWSLGKNDYGQLGLGKTSTYESKPTNTGWKNVDSIRIVDNTTLIYWRSKEKGAIAGENLFSNISPNRTIDTNPFYDSFYMIRVDKSLFSGGYFYRNHQYYGGEDYFLQQIQYDANGTRIENYHLFDVGDVIFHSYIQGYQINGKDMVLYQKPDFSIWLMDVVEKNASILTSETSKITEVAFDLWDSGQRNLIYLNQQKELKSIENYVGKSKKQIESDVEDIFKTAGSRGGISLIFRKNNKYFFLNDHNETQYEAKELTQPFQDYFRDTTDISINNSGAYGVNFFDEEGWWYNGPPTDDERQYIDDLNLSFIFPYNFGDFENLEYSKREEFSLKQFKNYASRYPQETHFRSHVYYFLDTILPHVVFRKADGSVWGLGGNDFKQINNSSKRWFSEPVQIFPLADSLEEGNSSKTSATSQIGGETSQSLHSLSQTITKIENKIQNLASKDELINATDSGRRAGISEVLNNPIKHGLTYLEVLKSSGATPHTNGWFFQPNWGWLWTSGAVFPYVYRSEQSGRAATWLYFRENSTPPYFFNYESQKWEKLGEGV